MTCGISALAKGQRGGQAGPGGRGGVVRISAVTRPGICNYFPEDTLMLPGIGFADFYKHAAPADEVAKGVSCYIEAASAQN